MAAIETLRREFPGSQVWRDYAKAVLGRVDALPTPTVFDGIDLETAQVIAVLVGDHASSWWSTSVSALEGASPAEIVAEYNDGLLIIRSLLMRFP
jgi:hypothetical protein